MVASISENKPASLYLFSALRICEHSVPQHRNLSIEHSSPADRANATATVVLPIPPSYHLQLTLSTVLLLSLVFPPTYTNRMYLILHIDMHDNLHLSVFYLSPNGLALCSVLRFWRETAPIFLSFYKAVRVYGVHDGNLPLVPQVRPLRTLRAPL